VGDFGAGDLQDTGELGEEGMGAEAAQSFADRARAGHGVAVAVAAASFAGIVEMQGGEEG